MVITRTNVHDDKLLAATLDAIVVSARSQLRKLFNACLDTGYDNGLIKEVVDERDYIARMQRAPTLV